MNKVKIKFENILSKIILILKRPDMNILPGNLAFFFVLSLIPLLSLVTYFATLFNIPIYEISNAIESLPSEIIDFFTPVLTDTKISFGNILTILISFFIASNGADSIILSSNKLYNIKQSSYIKRRIKAIFVTIIFVVIFLFMMLIPVFGNLIINFIGNYVNTNVYSYIKMAYNLLQLPLSLIIVYYNIKIIYIIAPDKPISRKEVKKGAIFTTISWTSVIQVYSYYVNNLANYSRIYGNLASLVILMLLIYLLSFIFTIGMALNAYKNELDKEINETGRINIIKSFHNI